MARIADPVEQMGAQIFAREGGRMPLTLTGRDDLQPISYTLPVASAQVKVAALVEKMGSADNRERQAAFRQLRNRMDPRRYNGATLVGLNGIVVKSHGSADAYAFMHAIATAVVEVEKQVPQQIGNLLQKEAA